MTSNSNTYVATHGTITHLKWNKQNTVWMLSLYGTAVGAGTLFLPINAGLHGIWPLLIMTILAFPMTYFSHRALCRFVLSGTGKKDITEVVDEHFGPSAGKFITCLYLFAIYPILLMYSIAITNTTNSFLLNQLNIQPPPRIILSLMLILALMGIVRLGQDIIVKSMSILVYPFVITLMLLALYLIPHWNDSIFHYRAIAQNGNSNSFFVTLWLIIPVMVFSFNHSPIISSFAVNQKEFYGKEADINATKIMKYSHLLMVGSVLFFVYSCVFSLSPHDLALAKQQNISILSYIANHFQTPVLSLAAPLIAFIAISKSFLGHYLGAREGLYSLMLKTLHQRNKQISSKKLNTAIEIIMIITCWIIATINPNILKMIETLGGPIIALILFLMPMFAIFHVPAMKQYQQASSNIFIIVIGFIALSAMIYGLL